MTLLRSFLLSLVLGSSLFAHSLTSDSASLAAEGVAVFVPSGYNAEENPSFSVISEPQAHDPLPADWPIKPQFSKEGGHVVVRVAVADGTSLYGTGEVTGSLLRNNHSITLWNTDNFAYSKDGGRRLYQTHPWVLGLRADGSSFGVLFDTTWRAELRCTDHEIVLRSDGPPCRVIVIDRSSPTLVLKELANLTGHLPLPPLWSLGFQQCRYSYYPDSRLREIADQFRQRHLPCDVLWVDIDFMDHFKIFTFSKDNYPDPTATNSYLHEHGFKSVWMVDPGVKIEKGYSVYESGKARNVWVKAADGSNYHGTVWPGPCVFPDFTMPETRAWWGSLYKDFLANGIDGIWNDMNEPAVFNGPDHSMPINNQHRGGGGIPPGPHARYHNVYGMEMVRATREGILAARPTKRPFVLTRDNYLGGQRYAATWTGDNVATWEDLKMSIPMSLNLGLSGQPVSGPDIGGYEKVATPDLFGHWISLGAFYPFARAHKAKGMPNQEPWEFGPKIEAVARTALNRRYRLLPYYYTLFHEASETGTPVMRPLFFADPSDPSLRKEDRAFLMGADLLVVPRWAQNATVPKGNWRMTHLLDDNSEDDSFQPLVRLRPGAAIPLSDPIQDTEEYDLKKLSLLVSPNEKGEAEGWLYEDAGDGFAYQKGDYALTHFLIRFDGKVAKVSATRTAGERPLPQRQLQVRVVSDSGELTGGGNFADRAEFPLSQ